MRFTATLLILGLILLAAIQGCQKSGIDIPAEPVVDTTGTPVDTTSTDTTTTTPTDTCAWSIVRLTIANRCATSGCHDGTIAPDFTDSLVVQSKANSGRISARAVDATSMPPASATALTADEQADLGCWIDNGANF